MGEDMKLRLMWCGLCLGFLLLGLILEWTQ